MVENYPKFVNIEDWNSLPEDVKNYLIDQQKKREQEAEDRRNAKL